MFTGGSPEHDPRTGSDKTDSQSKPRSRRRPIGTKLFGKKRVSIACGFDVANYLPSTPSTSTHKRKKQVAFASKPEVIDRSWSASAESVATIRTESAMQLADTTYATHAIAGSTSINLLPYSYYRNDNNDEPATSISSTAPNESSHSAAENFLEGRRGEGLICAQGNILEAQEAVNSVMGTSKTSEEQYSIVLMQKGSSPTLLVEVASVSESEYSCKNRLNYQAAFGAGVTVEAWLNNICPLPPFPKACSRQSSVSILKPCQVPRAKRHL